MYQPKNFFYILSVDIGIKNLALVLSQVKKNFSLDYVVWFENMDITDFYHLESPQECKLLHTKTTADWLEHIFYANQELFEAVNWIIIERQPPQGLVAVEQILFYAYRHKAVLIHPTSVHRWLGWSKAIDYEQRKVKSFQTALQILKKNPERQDLVTELESLPRGHDISDAICQTMFFLELKRREEEEQQRTERLKQLAQKHKTMVELEEYIDLDLDRFRFQAHKVNQELGEEFGV